MPPVDRVMHRWIHSTELVIGFFPEWFAALQPDWPPNTHLVGFPLWDGGPSDGLTEDVESFLASRTAAGRLYSRFGGCDDARLLP